ncbi:IS6 family transposase [Sedimentitalea sp. JM2-8]|uniref:IS6 family transposase n=1 Tax=Sedimentitalea xiamensis TaxID=3050037 RepID=A0ABT7FJH1_9RHOB|nr:IS6 family transposase [Sedimentitalea xiamensis]MDK3075280.1 IS6 family transposase [Sedimentitalea xiamensis]
MTKPDPFKCFHSSPEIIRLAVMLYVRFPLSLCNVEDLLHERGIEISHETVRYWWNRFGPMFAAEIRRKRVQQMRAFSNWQWHLDEMFVKVNGERHYLWRAVDHEGEVLESFVTKTRDKKAALKFLKKTMKRHGRPHVFVTDFRQPPELYAFSLKKVGIDIAPEELIKRAKVEFFETRSAMQILAPHVATKFDLDVTDYRDVIRMLKQRTIPDDQLVAVYSDAIADIETKIVEHGIVTLPDYPVKMRLSTTAEAAAQAAPHMQPPPLAGNVGQQGEFILLVSVPGADGKALAYDDFSFDAVRWTLSAHEARPGHELRFATMLDLGVSLARGLYAFNSVNVKGWALYAAAEMVPYESVEGQLIAMQHRLLRAARAFLDPMLNLGLISVDDAGEILSNDVVLSDAMVKQELDRYTFNAPGQAASYFYGCSRLLELRVATKLALGDKFDRKAFNNFILSLGQLPPD